MVDVAVVDVAEVIVFVGVVANGAVDVTFTVGNDVVIISLILDVPVVSIIVAVIVCIIVDVVIILLLT